MCLRLPKFLAPAAHRNKACRFGWQFSQLLFVLFWGVLKSDGASLHAQNTFVIQAKSLTESGKWEAARDTLKQGLTNNPQNENAWLLLGEIHAHLGEIKKEKSCYQLGLSRLPNSYWLHYRLGNWYQAHQRYLRARPHLLYFVEHAGQVYPQPWMDLTKIYHWFGDLNGAMKLLDALPDTLAAKKQKEIIRREKAPHLHLRALGSIDDQPLGSFQAMANLNWYKTALFQPTMGMDLPLFWRETAISGYPQWRMGNLSRWASTGTGLSFMAGLVWFSEQQQFAPIGQVGYTQTIWKFLSLKATLERKPYTLTRESMESLVMQTPISLSLDWENPSGWLFHTGSGLSFFDDQNWIGQLEAWVLSPWIIKGKFGFRLGYGFGFSEAMESRYQATQPLDSILLHFPENGEIEGSFQPYFTPKGLHQHQGLSQFRFRMPNRTSLTLHSAIGFFASNETPYLYLQESNGDLHIEQNFSTLGMVTTDLSLSFRLPVGSQTELTMSYHWLRTFFYQSHALGINLSFPLAHEAKKR